MPDTRGIKVGPVTVMVVRAGDRVVSSIESGKPFESESLEAWASMCKGGGTVLDIGAYTGLFAISARLMGCECLAFEPMPFNRERFKANAKLNSVSDAVNSEVVSDRIGDMTIVYNAIPFTSGASLLRRTGTKRRVKSLTIDSLNMKHLHAVKIDVERAEPLVLKGALATLKRTRPAMLVEVLDAEQERRVLKELRGLYRVDRRLDVRNWLMLPC